ncbi:MAG: hypothetical protein GF331_19485 [Chitinivibrionales bacterium]|nr:hypothetical protein [Chitinivibrionales bacterium]
MSAMLCLAAVAHAEDASSPTTDPLITEPAPAETLAADAPNKSRGCPYPPDESDRCSVGLGEAVEGHDFLENFGASLWYRW